MSLPRPLPKNLLKKMYMKTLYEHKRPGGRYNNVGSNYGGILRLNFQFSILQFSMKEVIYWG